MYNMRNKPKARSNNRYHRPNNYNHNTVDDMNKVDSRCRHNTSYIRQMIDKFTSLAQDSRSAGDRVQATLYFQQADHFQRLFNERQPDKPQQDETQHQPNVEKNNMNQSDTGEYAADKESKILTKNPEKPQNSQDKKFEKTKSVKAEESHEPRKDDNKSARSPSRRTKPSTSTETPTTDTVAPPKRPAAKRKQPKPAVDPKGSAEAS